MLDGHLLETRDSLQRVVDAYNAKTQVVPDHGPVTNIDAIQWHIDYLTEVETEVRRAISAGLSLEKIIKNVQAPDFQGYALFDWLHPILNVPAAYNSLK